jgi:NAD(P)-dependent dehydrogenase (short-subunit alcohol dehydrogenase family)
MVQAAISEFGKVDVLINNAGPQPKPRRPLWEMTDEDWHSEMDVVLTSAFYCCRAVSRHMVERQQGKIINIASGFGLRGLRYEYTYCTGKGGMIQLTKALALTWAKNGINVNCIAPGFIGVRHSNTEEEQKFFEERGKFIPVGYVGSPEDVAYLAVFLASEASDYMTGAVVIIDGGAMAGGYAPAEYEPARAI